MIDYILEHAFKTTIIAVTGVIVMFFVAFVLGVYPFRQFPHVSGEKWQAVFLTNNQVYFGKLRNLNAQYVALSDVYYLRTASDLNGGGNLNLIKLGGELHGPEDEMYIPKTQILFWENMKSSSRVVQSINNAQ